jgi:hypothetical protein
LAIVSPSGGRNCRISGLNPIGRTNTGDKCGFALLVALAMKVTDKTLIRHPKLRRAERVGIVARVLRDGCINDEMHNLTDSTERICP